MVCENLQYPADVVPRTKPPNLTSTPCNKRETAECDAGNVRGYNGDLDTALIFVRFCKDLNRRAVLTPFL